MTYDATSTMHKLAFREEWDATNPVNVVAYSLRVSPDVAKEIVALAAVEGLEIHDACHLDRLWNLWTTRSRA